MRAIPVTAVIVAATIVAAPLAASADMSLGANAANSRINEGTFDGHNAGWKAYLDLGGDTVALEAGYIDFGRYGVENTGANAWTPALKIGVPAGPVNVYGKAGVAFADFEGTSVKEESKNNDPFYGLGLRFGITPGLGLRAEYERYRFDRADVDVGMLGLELRFGGPGGYR